MGVTNSKGSREGEKPRENVILGTQDTEKKNAKADHYKYTKKGNSDQSQLVSLEEREKAKQKLEKMRQRYKINDTSHGEEISLLNEEIKKQIKDIKHNIKELYPL